MSQCVQKDKEIDQEVIYLHDLGKTISTKVTQFSDTILKEDNLRAALDTLKTLLKDEENR